MIHYTALGDERTACDLPCRAPTEEKHTVKATWPIVRIETIASLDPRLVTCPDPECVSAAKDAPRCACGAPALYGALAADAEPKFCADCADEDARCMQCAKPLLDAAESFCDGCLDATDVDNGRDGITEHADPAGLSWPG